MNDHVISPSRRPIVIADSQLSTGQASTSVRSDDAEALLRDYLRLIRKVRNQQRARNIALRRVDIETLAHHLDWTDDAVLARLADLMGATRRQRATMLAVLSTGAALITVASPMSAAATGGTTSLDQTEPPVVIEAGEITNVGAGVGRPLGRVGDDTAEVPRRAPVLDLQADLASFSHTAAAHEFAAPAAAEVADQQESTPAPDAEATTASEPATGPDGATVAVGQAPVPPTSADDSIETGTDADGNTVAVGQAPVPPTPAPEPAAATPQPERIDVAVAEVETPDVETPEVETPDVETPEVETPDVETPEVRAPEVETPDVGTTEVEGAIGTDADGNTVAVGQAPVPPTPADGIETGTDADGNTVAVGQPPVPPAPEA